MLRAIHYILSIQREDGSWEGYVHGRNKALQTHYIKLLSHSTIACMYIGTGFWEFLIIIIN